MSHEDFSEALRRCQVSAYNMSRVNPLDFMRERLGLDDTEAMTLLAPLGAIFVQVSNAGADPFASLFAMGMHFAEELRDVRKERAGQLDEAADYYGVPAAELDRTPDAPRPRFIVRNYGTVNEGPYSWAVWDMERNIIVATWHSRTAADADALRREGSAT